MINYSKNIFLDITTHTHREINSFRFKGIDALLFLTYRCTSRCKTCNMWKRKSAVRSQELDWSAWEKILKSFKEYGVKSVEIFGGDALLRKNVIFKMIRFCKESDIDTYFPTNSILLDEETAKNLVDSGLGTIYFSLDDIGDESDRIRGVKDSFFQVKQALEAIVKARGTNEFPKIIICTTISKLNYQRLEGLMEFLSHYPIDAVYPRPLGEFSDKNIELSNINGILPDPYFVTTEDSHLLSKDQIDEFREITKTLKKKYKSKKPYINFSAVDMSPDMAFTEGRYGTKRCHCCTTLITVAPNGDVMPCTFFPNYTLGNLEKEPINSIWGRRNLKHKDFVQAQRKKQIAICDNCNMRQYYPTLIEKLLYFQNRMKERILA